MNKKDAPTSKFSLYQFFIMTRQFKFWATALLLLLTMQSCSYIDDDRSDCENTYSLTYQLEVVSNINMQLSEQLKVDAGSMTLKTLDKYFQSVLQPTTTEARLGFYPIGGNPIFFNRDIEGQRTAFSIAIPANNYRHIAVIGQSDPSIFLTDSAKASTVRLTQFLRDTVDSHVQAVMAGTLDMNVLGNQNQSWQVDLYPADAGVAVVMKRNAKVQRLRVFLADLATSFTPDDSTWHWDHTSLVRTVPVDVSGTDSIAYCGVAFPSHAATTAAKAIIPAATRADDNALWHVVILADMPDGTVTRTVLSLSDALRAGDIRVIRVRVNDNGGISTTDSNVGASVTLDWKKGGEYNPEL